MRKTMEFRNPNPRMNDEIRMTNAEVFVVDRMVVASSFGFQTSVIHSGIRVSEFAFRSCFGLFELESDIITSCP